MLITCPQCGCKTEKASGVVNRSRRLGWPVYCGRTCAGLAHRTNKSDAEKRAAKAEYDRKYRAAGGEELLAKKRSAYRDRLERDPEGLRAAQKSLRTLRRTAHAEYCRQPEYRAKKKTYDRQHRAHRFYGPFADAFLALQDLETEIAVRASRYEIYSQNGTLNKALRRKREYANSFGC